MDKRWIYMLIFHIFLFIRFKPQKSSKATRCGFKFSAYANECTCVCGGPSSGAGGWMYSLGGSDCSGLRGWGKWGVREEEGEGTEEDEEAGGRWTVSLVVSDSKMMLLLLSPGTNEQMKWIVIYKLIEMEWCVEGTYSRRYSLLCGGSEAWWESEDTLPTSSSVVVLSDGASTPCSSASPLLSLLSSPPIKPPSPASSSSSSSSSSSLQQGVVKVLL